MLQRLIQVKVEGLYKIFGGAYFGAITSDENGVHSVHGGSVVLFDIQFDRKGLLNAQAQFIVVISKQANSLGGQTGRQNSGCILLAIPDSLKDGVGKTLVIVIVAQEKCSGILMGGVPLGCDVDHALTVVCGGFTRLEFYVEGGLHSVQVGGMLLHPGEAILRNLDRGGLENSGCLVFCIPTMLCVVCCV
jgi:hypothetical protein